MYKFIWIFFILLYFNTSAQLQLGNETHYARALKIHQKTLFVGFSDGELYAVNLKNKHIQKIDAPKSLVEIRDLEILGDELYVMESSDTSELWKLNLIMKVWTPIKLVHDAVFLDDLIATKHEVFAFGDAIHDSLVMYSIRSDSAYNEAKFMHGLPMGKIALFAASGSAVQRIGSHVGVIYQATGSFYTHCIPGKHFYGKDKLPLLQVESGGAFSQVIFDLKKKKNITIVGGDYLNPNRNDSIACYSTDAGETFLLSESQPKGYRSHVIQLKNGKLMAVGPTGIDVSTDGGKNWRFVHEGKFHATIRAGKHVYVTSNGGKVFRFEWKAWF